MFLFITEDGSALEKFFLLCDVGVSAWAGSGLEVGAVSAAAIRRGGEVITSVYSPDFSG